jgi:Tol biopolymer transport system component/tRNA A-37 threonylcarbamoyl transferase component Bud32
VTDIAVGSRIGAYEISALIGAGGMGRVFRARDTRLKRDVAIKALPQDMAFGADSAARFRREAEALASLNHPHIASIHDLVESGDSQFLVMELVEGETLAELIRRGPVPVDEALRLARQIAEALEAAHARGIVHRDLKPANVKVTPQGQVKVLDFGLAKDLGAEAARVDVATLTHSPTIVGSATRAGVILGTAAYMSPEQARGQRVDAQADIWAFGCVLFEMLTARQPFTGATVTDLLAAVVRGEPDWPALPAATPAGVRSLLRRLLQKDRARRVHHIADARIEIDEALAGPAADETPTVRRGSNARAMTAAAAVLGAVVLGLAIALVWALRPAAAAPEMRVDITTPLSQAPAFLALSPDGTKLAFVASGDGMSRLWVRTLDGSPAQPLSGTDLATGPFWSPDSRSLGFFADGKLRRIDLAGGLTRTLADATIAAGGSWNRDGVIVFAPTSVGPLFRVSAAGGEAVAITKMTSPAQGSHRLPHFLPDDRHFLFFSRGNLEQRGIYLGDLDGSEPRRLTESDSGGVLTSNGYLLFVRQGTLFARPFDLSGLKVSGEAVAVANNVMFDSYMSAAALTVSAAGPIAFRTSGAFGGRQLTWFDRAGRRGGTVGPDDPSLFNPELSPDNRSVAINRTVDLHADIWLIESERGVLRRFTFDASVDQIPVWSPDGRRIVFSSNRKNAYDLFTKPASGPGSEDVVLESPENKFAMGVSPDGRHLLYRNTGPNTDWDLWAVPLTGERRPFAIAQTKFQEMMAEFSPDGRWVAYQTNESGQYEIYIQSFPEPGVRAQVSIEGGSQPRWRPDGKELFYVSLSGRLMAAPISVDSTGQIISGTSTPLFETRIVGGPVPTPQKQQYAVSRDGQRFLINTQLDTVNLQPVTIVLNWSPLAAK